MKLKGLEEIVCGVLERQPITRDDDFLLYGTVVVKMGVNLNMPFKEFLRKHKELGVPSFESVSRCRRKLQMLNAKLMPSAKVIEKREKEQDKFYAYSLGIDEEE